MTDLLAALTQAQHDLATATLAAGDARLLRDDTMLDAHLGGATYEKIAAATGLTPKSIVAGLDRARGRRGLPTSKDKKEVKG